VGKSQEERRQKKVCYHDSFMILVHWGKFPSSLLATFMASCGKCEIAQFVVFSFLFCQFVVPLSDVSFLNPTPFFFLTFHKNGNKKTEMNNSVYIYIYIYICGVVGGGGWGGSNDLNQLFLNNAILILTYFYKFFSLIGGFKNYH
jgi:hypothetical protein